MWGSVPGFPGAIIRVVPGPNPTETALAERYGFPWLNPNAPIQGYSPRGMDVDRNGVAWAALGSGHLASFDRRKCSSPLNGPKATAALPGGLDALSTAAPAIQERRPTAAQKAATSRGSISSTRRARGKHADRHGIQSDAFLALKDGKWVVLRVRYPMGFSIRSGWTDVSTTRNGGWKARGLWSTVSSRAPFHMERAKAYTANRHAFPATS